MSIVYFLFFFFFFFYLFTPAVKVAIHQLDLVGHNVCVCAFILGLFYMFFIQSRLDWLRVLLLSVYSLLYFMFFFNCCFTAGFSFSRSPFNSNRLWQVQTRLVNVFDRLSSLPPLKIQLLHWRHPMRRLTTCLIHCSVSRLFRLTRRCDDQFLNRWWIATSRRNTKDWSRPIVNAVRVIKRLATIYVLPRIPRPVSDNQ